MVMIESERNDGREERGDRTARGLLDAARHAFAERGFVGASVRDIAGAACVNPALIRYHFGSKEGLYQRVIEGVVGALRDRLLEAFNQGDTVIARMEHVVDALLEHMTEHPEFPMLVQRALLDGDERASTVARETLRPMLDAMRPTVEAVGQTPLGGLNDIILSFFGALMGPFLYGSMLSALFDEDTLSPAVIDRRKKHLKSLLVAVAKAGTAEA